MCRHEADQFCVDLRDECYSNYNRAARAPRLIQTFFPLTIKHRLFNH